MLLGAEKPAALFPQAGFVVALLFVLSGMVIAQRNEPPNRTVAFSVEVREQIKKVIPAIGLVLVRNAGDADQTLRPRGSAVIVRKDGLVMTNFHVIARDRSVRLFDDLFLSLPAEASADATTAARQYRLKPLLTNQERDLALLRIESATPLALPFIELGDTRSVELLDDIFIIGFPEKGGTTVTVNPGVVEGKDALDDWIKTNGRLLHGNSGGAAVNSAGKLIGIPTRVVVDSDAEKNYGSVGYLRPAHLVAAMISKYQEAEMNAAAQKTSAPKTAPATTAPPTTVAPVESRSPAQISVHGLVKSASGEPLAGVRVGLLLVGSEVAASNIITWGGSNAEGKFVLEKPIAPGRYNLRARVVGYEAFSRDLEISAATLPLVIELKPAVK